MTIQCAGSDVLVDPRPPRSVTEAVCPSCGRIVPLGGTPFAPRYSVHNEPTVVDTASDLVGLSFGDAFQRYVFGDAPDMKEPAQ